MGFNALTPSTSIFRTVKCRWLAWFKGRSSSHQINCLLRQSLADHLSSNVRPFYGYVRSKLNPADDPTRSASLRGPVRPSAGWFVRALEGCFDKFDAELRRRELDILQLSGLPDSSELYPDAVIDGSTSAQRKSLRGKRRRGTPRSEVRADDPEGTEPSSSSSTSLKSGKLQPSSLSLKPSATLPMTECLPRSSSLKQMQSRTMERPLKSSSHLDGDSGSSGNTVVTGENWIADALLGFRRDQFVYSSEFASLEEAIASGPGLLDLFSGSRGFATSFVKRHSTWALCFDLAHSSSEDLLNPQLQSDLRKLLGSGALLAMACSPVCASFSTAITPPLRTCEYPAGRPDLTELQNVKIRLGQKQLEFTLAMVRICIEVKVIFWVENPDSSWFWRQKGNLSWDRILATSGVRLFRCDQCRYNTRWRKRTRFLTNCHLAGQKVLCRCTEPHVVLRGRCKEKSMNYTKLAEAYIRGNSARNFLRRWASMRGCTRDFVS